MESPSEVTRLLHAYRKGERDALERLVPLLYQDLRERARQRLRGERADHTLETAALVHEAYLRLLDIERVEWRDREHFLAVASRVMRRVLVDYGRRRRADKRGGGERPISLDEGAAGAEVPLATLVAVGELLEKLETEHPRTAAVVEQRYLGGLTNDEIGRLNEVSVSTVERELRFGRAWLAEALGERPAGDEP